MKSFKKVLSLFLAVICVLGMFTTGAFAVDEIIGGLLGGEDEEEAALSYGIHYEIDTYSGVSVMYKPSPDISFKVPSRVEVTSDMPLAIDYECIAWRAEDGRLYYPGDTILVTGKVVLNAVWEPKQDNDSHVIRTVKTAFQTFIRMIQSALGIFKVLNTPESELTTKPAVTTTTTKPVISLTSAIS